MVIFVFGWSKE